MSASGATFLLCAVLFVTSVAAQSGTKSPIGTKSPGPTTTCLEPEFIEFISTLPNALSCGEGIEVYFRVEGATSLTSEEGRQKFSEVCKQDCAGKIIEWLRGPSCDDQLEALDLELACYQTNGEVGDFCRYVYIDAFNTALLDNLAICGLATEEVPCVPGCAEAVRAFTEQAGCCYQTVYNNTDYINGLLARNFIPQESYFGLLALASPITNPWRLCGMEPPKACVTNPGIGSGELSLKTNAMFILIISLSLALIMYKE